MSKYDFSVFNGRMNPGHEGHKEVIMGAAKVSDFVIAALGSHGRARSTRDPFTTDERIEILYALLPEEIHSKILFAPVCDALYDDDQWLVNVQESVDNCIEKAMSNGAVLTNRGWRDYKYNIALAGMFKDKTSYYLNSFPQWDNSIAINPVASATEVYSATNVRKKLFRGEIAYAKEIPLAVRKKIEEIMARNPEIWENLRKDFDYEQKYEAVYGKGPHVTVDAVVVQAGHILLIERGGDYGRGSWALPGGFLERDETTLQGMIRELREETRLKVPEKVLKGSITNSRIFDDPYRSNRSRIITHAFGIRLENVGELPKVVGQSDAKKAKWVALSEVNKMENVMFEDHYHIIKKMVGFN